MNYKMLFNLLLLIPVISFGTTTLNNIAFIKNEGQLVNTNGLSANEIQYYIADDAIRIYFLKGQVGYEYIKYNADNNLVVQYRMDMELIDANPDCDIISLDKQQEYTNYYLGHCPEGITGVPQYRKLIYKNIYPNIDLVFYVSNKSLKYDFIVHPGGKPEKIKFKYSGSDEVILAQSGKLLISNPIGILEEAVPVVFQPGDNNIVSGFNLNQNIISFNIFKYDQTQDLIIDPALAWSTYIPATVANGGPYVTTDEDGYLYLTGQVSGVGLPVVELPGGYYQTVDSGAKDLFVSKFDRNGVLLWCTYYGGNQPDVGRAIKVSSNKNIYVTGQTNANSTFPLDSVPGAYYQGKSIFTGKDAFILKFDKAGIRQWATLYGGTGEEEAWDLVISEQEEVYILGVTQSNNLPVLNPGNNAYYQDTLGNYAGVNTGYDLFLTSFDMNGQQTWGTYFGGTDDEYNGTQSGCPGIVSCGAGRGIGPAMTIDNNGNIFVTGLTLSLDFPMVDPGVGAYYDDSYNGGYFDATISRFSSSYELTWSTYYGGSGVTSTGSDDERGAAMVTDNAGNLYVVGKTYSSDFPLDTLDGKNMQGTYGGDDDIFISKFNAAGVNLWGTFWGGTSDDEAWGVGLDPCGYIYVGGSTRSTNLPTDSLPGSYYSSSRGAFGDAFMMRIDSTGLIDWSTYIGGTTGTSENGWDLTVSPYGEVYLAGYRGSANYPLVDPGNGAYAASTGSNYISKFQLPLPDVGFTISGSSNYFCPGEMVQFTDTSTSNPDSWYWEFDDQSANGADTSNLQNPSYTFNEKGNYDVKLTITKGCQVNAGIHQVIITHPDIELGNDTTVCEGNVVLLDATELSTGSYLWSTGEITPTINATEEIAYWVEVTDTNGCMAKDTLNVMIDSTIQVELGADTTICGGDTVQLVISDNQNNTVYTWFPDSSVTINIITVTKDGTYKIIVSNACGTSADSINIGLKNCNDLFIPNVFSPNGNGINDDFNISSGPINQISVSIYDNLGTLIFFTDDLSVKWNGTYRGLEVEGVFVYKVTGEFADNTTFDQSGNVQVIR